MLQRFLLRRKASVWFAAACTVISWAGLGSYWSTHRLVRTYDSAAESHRALEKLQEIQAAMETAQGSVDEYVITGKSERLAPFRETSSRIHGDLKEMEALVRVYPEQFENLQRLQRMILGHLSYLRNVARVRRTRGVSAASSWIATDARSSPRAMTKKLLAEFRHRERLTVKQRTALASRGSTLAQVVLMAAAVLSVGFLIWAFVLWLQESRERAHAEWERGRLESFLSSIIERIPYIVLVKEARALRVVLVNHAAAESLGRAEEELLGANVFDWRPEKEAEEEARQDRQALAAEEPIDIPEENVTVEGRTRIFHTQKVMIPDPEGQPAYLVTIAEDVTDRKRGERMLELSRDSAVESARLKSEFLRNMTHEIRTPLSIIVGMSTLLNGTSLDPKQKEFTASVRKAAEGLEQLVKNLLDFSKIETGSFQLEMQKLSLTETVEGVLRMFSDQASAKGVQLTSVVAKDIPVSVWGDGSRLRQALTHLVGNAIKFTAHGTVDVHMDVAKQNDTHIWITCHVKDSGVGIDPAAQASVFNAFQQGDGSATRKFGGLGLGLAITRRIVELMGGEIGMESQPNTGSTFSMIIPFNKEGTAERPEPEAPRVLVVEENEIVRERFRQQLSLWGLYSRGAAGGETALSLLRQEHAAGRPIPVVLVGMQLADMDGASFASIIQKDPALRGTPMVAVADTGMDPSVAAALGFNGSAALTQNAGALYEALAPFISLPPSRGGRAA